MVRNINSVFNDNNNSNITDRVRLDIIQNLSDTITNYVQTVGFTITVSDGQPYIVASSNSSDRQTEIFGTISIDHDNNVATDPLAVTIRGGSDVFDATENHWVYTGTYGTLTISPDGSYTYVLDQASASLSARADDTFRVQLTDAEGNDHLFTITVPINHVDDTEKESVSVSVEEHYAVDEDHGAGTFAAVPAVDVDSSQPQETSVVVHGIRFTVIQEADTAFDWRVRFEVSAHHTSSSEAIFIHTPGGAGNSNIRTFVFSGAGLSTITYSQQEIVDLVNSDSDVSPRIRAEIETVMSFNYNAQSDRDVFIKSANFVETSGDGFIVTGSTEEDQLLSISGTITIDHDNTDTTAALAITPSGGAGQYRANADNADFLAAHGLSGDEDWWVYTGSYGTLVVKSDGSFTYVLNADQATGAERVDDVFTLQVADSNGRIHQVVLTVPINTADDDVKDGASIVLDPATVADQSGSVLFTFPFTDADEGDTISFALDSAIGQNGEDLSALFEVDATTGEVRLVSPLDHEQAFFVEITVSVTNASELDSTPAGGAPQTTVTTRTVLLEIRDVNEAPTAITIDNTVVHVTDGIIPQPTDTDGVPDSGDETPGGQFVATLSVADPDDAAFETFTYRIEGADAASFEIRNGNELWLVADGRVPAESEAWDISIVVADKGGLEVSLPVEITRNGLHLTRDDINDGAAIFSDGVALLPEGVDVSVESNDVIVTVNGTPAILLGALAHHLPDAVFTTSDAGFMIDNGNLYFTGTSGDYEAGDSHSVTITATWAGGSQTYTYAVNLQNLNDEAPEFGAPVVLDLDGITADQSLDSNDLPVLDGNGNAIYTVSGVQENSDPSIVIYQAQASDADGDTDTVQYSLDPTVEDNAYFTIDADTGEVRFSAPPNYERAADSKTSGQYVIVITASSVSTLPDAIANVPLVSTQQVTITVDNVNEAPTRIFLDTPAISGDNITTSSLQAIDPDQDGDQTLQDGFTFITVDDATAADGEVTDTALFTVNDNGEIEFIGTDEDRKTSGEVYQIRVQVEDAEGLTHTQILTIAEGSIFINVANTPSDPTDDRFSSYVDDAGEGLLDENADGSGTPVDVGFIGGGTGANTQHYALATADEVAGEVDTSIYDNDQFQISNAGVLQFIGTDSGNFEAGDSLTVRIKVTDLGADDAVGGGDDTVSYETYVIRLRDVNEGPSFATATTAGNIFENEDGSVTAVEIVSVEATDPEGDPVTYSLDQASIDNGFAIDAETGLISYVGSGLDRETTDSYTLTVTASSSAVSGGTAIHTVTITVDDVNEPPVFDSNASTAGTIEENNDGSTTAIAITTVTASDPEGDTVSYSLDAASTSSGFAIDAATGDITYIGTGLDFESVREYTITVTASSIGGTATHDVTVTVTNQPPVFDADAPTVAEIAENLDGSSSSISITTVTATDPDGFGVVYSLDQASLDIGFGINAITGAITYSGTGFDYETQNTFDVVVRATTAGVYSEHTVTINVLNVNEAPVVDAITAQAIVDTAEKDNFAGSGVPVVTPDSTVDESVIVHGIKFTILQEADKAYQWRISFTNTASSGLQRWKSFRIGQY